MLFPIARKLDRLILGEFIPFFLMGVAAFTLLMVAVTLFKEMLTYVTTYGLSPAEVGVFFILALPQTIAYTLPMAVLFSGLLAFGRLSETQQITALRAGGIGFFRIVLPALVFAWFVVLCTFLLNEKVAPQSTVAAKNYIQSALVEKGITQERTDISYMDQDAGWLFSAARGEGNVFYDVKWWDFSRPGETTIYTADRGIWEKDRWIFENARAMNIASMSSSDPSESAGPTGLVEGQTTIHTITSPSLEMRISRTPSDILAQSKRDPEEMSLQELAVFLKSEEVKLKTEDYKRKILATYFLKIAAPFASVIFILLAAPLALAPQRSSSTFGIGLSMLLVFFYYMMTTFAVKVAEGGLLPPIISAWIPNLIFLAAGIFLNARFYMRNT
jgi:lipopolysaccharide export system permease protein